MRWWRQRKLRPEFIDRGRNDDAVTVLLACALSGLIQLWSQEVPGSVARIVSDPLRVVWSVSLLGFATTALVGLFYDRRPDIGLLLERTGRLGLAGVLLSYAIAASALVGVSGAFPALLAAGFGVGSIVRSWRITVSVRHMDQQNHDEQPPTGPARVLGGGQGAS